MTTMNGNCVDDGVVERSVSANSAVMACKKEKIIVFSSTSCFVFFNSFFFSSSRAITRATHYMIVSSKTHRNA
jgi:hypothetical protein